MKSNNSQQGINTLVGMQMQAGVEADHHQHTGTHRDEADQDRQKTTENSFVHVDSTDTARGTRAFTVHMQVLVGCVCKRGAGRGESQRGRTRHRVPISGAGNRKVVGGRNPHRCEVSRKQSPGSIVPAGDGCQH